MRIGECLLAFLFDLVLTCKYRLQYMIIGIVTLSVAASGAIELVANLALLVASCTPRTLPTVTHTVHIWNPPRRLESISRILDFHLC